METHLLTKKSIDIFSRENKSKCKKICSIRIKKEKQTYSNVKVEKEFFIENYITIDVKVMYVNKITHQLNNIL